MRRRREESGGGEEGEEKEKEKEKNNNNPGRELVASVNVLISFSVSLLMGPHCFVQILLGVL